MLRTKSFLTVLTAAVLCLMPAIMSCNGNGDAADMDGDTYNPGGGGGGYTGNNSASSGTSGSGSSGGISASDILNFSNSSEGMETLIDKLATGGTTEQNAGAGTQAVTFSADDIGLPSGGSAVLTISGGGYNYSGTARADASGNVTFEIPMIASGSSITVSLSVKAADGTLLYSGSREQVVRGDSMQISVALTRQFWTLPASFRAVASPAGLLYRAATADSVTSTISVEGLDGAPADVSYVWTDEAGSQLGTGPTLIRTASEVTGGIVPADEITKTYTVTVSYTDAAGEAKTASASASVTVGGPVTLPAFSISMAAPASMAPSAGASSPWFLTDLTDGFTLTPDSATGSFPGGTSFHWEIEATGGALITRTTATGEDCTVSPDDLGLTASTIGTQAAPTTISVRCTAKNDRADADVDAPPATQGAYALSLPDFTIDIVMDTDGYNAALSDLTDPENPVYALTDLTKEFTFTASPGAGVSFPTGTKFQWKITGEGDAYEPALSAANDVDIEATVDLFGLTDGIGGTLGTTPAAANTITIECTATHDYAIEDVDATAASANVFYISVPEGFVLVEGNGSTVGHLFVCDHEVTQAEYEAYCGYGIQTLVAAASTEPYVPTDATGKGTDYPAYNVSWYDALVYCNLRSMAEGLTPCYKIGGSTDPAAWSDIETGSGGKPCGPNTRVSSWDAVTMNTSANGYRLPTKAEWVYAAKGGPANDSYTYSGSNTVGDVAWYSSNSGDSGGSTNKKTHPVKTKNPNSAGIYDMSGNIHEWCWDENGSERVIMGGNYSSIANQCTISSTFENHPISRNPGFRVVRNAD